MNSKKIGAIFLAIIALIIIVWSLFNLLVEQNLYNGPHPLTSIVAIIFLIKAHKLYKKA